MALSILGALCSAFAVPITSDESSIFTFLAITRFFLGMGVGGVYPLSATIAAESATSNASRGTSTQIVFSMQGVANLLVPMVGALALQLFGNPGVATHGSDMGWSWRFVLALGALPGICLIPFKAAAKPKNPNAVSAAAPPGLMETLKMRKYWGGIVGCAGGWFLFDITFYGNSLFQSTVLKQVFKTTKHEDGAPINLSGGLHDNLCWQMTIVAALGLPGYYVALALMDKMGRRNMQLQGFFMMAVVFLALGIWQHQLDDVPVLMLILYGLTFFFSNFGPNSTTFALPSETFPSNVRTTLNGFSAAMGKVGATIGSSCFKPLADSTSLSLTMCMCAVVSLLGFALTWFFVVDRRDQPMESFTQCVDGAEDVTEELYDDLEQSNPAASKQHSNFSDGVQQKPI